MDPLSSIQGPGGQSVLSSSGGGFDENPFLEILVTQMQNQSPLNPVDDNSFMEQMASFNNMEEQKQLNENLLELLNFQGLLAKLQGLSEGSALLGKQITYDQNGLEGKGIAESVFVNEEGELRIVVGGDEISVHQVTGVSEPDPSTTTGV